jgi:thiol:disulfide interchange protein DsbC
MRRNILIALIAALLAPAVALGDNKAPPELTRLIERIMPGVKPDRIEPAPIAGLYEVVYGADVYYISADGRYLLDGSVFDLEQHKNLTDPIRQQARLAAINRLGEKNMIVFAPQQVKYTVTVFTDVECGFCRQFHQQVGELNDLGVKVRYLAFPRAGIGSSAYQTMVSVWCSDNPQKAITDAKLDKPVAPKQCKNPVREEYELGRTIGVRGTPTIILDNGELVPGYVPPKQLVQLLAAEHKAARRDGAVPGQRRN